MFMEKLANVLKTLEKREKKKLKIIFKAQAKRGDGMRKLIDIK